MSWSKYPTNWSSCPCLLTIFFNNFFYTLNQDRNQYVASHTNPLQPHTTDRLHLKVVASKLGAMERDGRAASQTTHIHSRRKAVLSIREKIRHAMGSELDVEDQAGYLKFLQMEAVSELSGHQTVTE